MMPRWLFLVLLSLCVGCAQAGAAVTSTPDLPRDGNARAVRQPAETVLPAETIAAPIATAAVLTMQTAEQIVHTATPEYSSAEWRSAPILPTLSPRAIEILQESLDRGANPRAFSKIGDCESQTTWFLGNFDLGAEHYRLGPYEEEYETVIAYFQGSFNRLSMAARQGYTGASLLAPIWADKKTCQKDETPLACEYRLNRPLVALIMVGTNDASNPATFERNMRKVIEYSLEQSVLPILGTKADNLEGDHQINETIARLAYEYELPLWNYWRAVQDLPGHGLQEDGAHLTYAAPFFDDPRALQRAWPVRNLNALEILKRVMDATPPSD